MAVNDARRDAAAQRFPLIPDIEPDDTIAPRPEEELADIMRAEPETPARGARERRTGDAG